MELKQKRDRIRRKIKDLNERKLPCLLVHKSGVNIYGQVIDSKTGKVITQFSSLNKEFKKLNLKGYNIEGAKFVGNYLGKQIKEKGISEVVFDRSGYKYHGRIKALMESVKEVLSLNLEKKSKKE